MFFIIIGIENFTTFKLTSHVSYGNIKITFEALANNKLPDEKDFNIAIYKNFLYILFILYFISCLFGYLAYKLIRITHLDTLIPIFRFKNYWHYLVKSNKINGNGSPLTKYLYTNADVLIEGNDKTELYSGYVQNYFTDTITNKLNCIILKKAYKFISIDNDNKEDVETSIRNNENIYELHREYKDKTIYKKYIPGDILTLFDDRIININLTYVEQVINPKQKRQAIINSIYYVLVSFCLFTPWLIQHDLISTFKRKLIIGLIGLWIFTNIKNYLLNLLKLTEKQFTFKDFALSLIFYSLPLLWFLKIINYKLTFLVMVIYFIIMIILLGGKKER